MGGHSLAVLALTQLTFCSRGRRRVKNLIGWPWTCPRRALLASSPPSPKRASCLEGGVHSPIGTESQCHYYYSLDHTDKTCKHGVVRRSTAFGPRRNYRRLHSQRKRRRKHLPTGAALYLLRLDYPTTPGAARSEASRRRNEQKPPILDNRSPGRRKEREIKSKKERSLGTRACVLSQIGRDEWSSSSFTAPTPRPRTTPHAHHYHHRN